MSVSWVARAALLGDWGYRPRYLCVAGTLQPMRLYSTVCCWGCDRSRVKYYKASCLLAWYIADVTLTVRVVHFLPEAHTNLGNF